MESDDITLQLVAERVRGLRDVTEQGFKDIQRQLDDVRNLPSLVSAIKERQDAHERRITTLEATGVRGSEFRRGTLPMIVLTLALALTSAVALLSQIH